MKLRSNLHGIGRHSLDEIAGFSYQDLDAISALLGDKPFFSGDSPSTFGSLHMLSPPKKCMILFLQIVLCLVIWFNSSTFLWIFLKKHTSKKIVQIWQNLWIE